MNIKDIKELILTIDGTSIERVDIEQKDLKISISKSAIHKNEDHKISQNEINIEKTPNEIKEDREENSDEVFVVKSPIVGVFYAAPSPDSEPFVKVGDNVEKGQSLCIIEAMKIMNEIESEVSGKVIEIMVKNEETVEYGQPLMKIRR